VAEPLTYRRDAETIIPQFLDELRAWVDIDSGTYDKAGVDRVGELVRSRLARSGFVVTAQSDEVYGDHLIGRRTGQGRLRLLLIGHMDTVYPAGAVQERPFTIRDGRAYGPGIFDMKSGILGAITALDLVGDEICDRFGTITFLCNSDEEIGSPSSTPLVRALAGEADAALVFEPVREPTSVVVGRKGIAAYTLDVAGLSAHAGVTPESGRNAILELAHRIIALQALHGSMPSVSVNVGAVTGGGRRNVVPAHAQALFEMRAADIGTFTQAQEAIAAVVAAPPTVPDTLVTLTAGPQHLPLEPNDGSRRMVALARQAGTPLGLHLHPLRIGGASDGNTTGGMGVPTLDGLGLVGQYSHHPDEHIILDAIPTRLALIASIIAALPDSDLAGE
jgi:glutamate carboxypeptidase